MPAEQCTACTFEKLRSEKGPFPSLLLLEVCTLSIQFPVSDQGTSKMTVFARPPAHTSRPPRGCAAGANASWKVPFDLEVGCACRVRGTPVRPVRPRWKPPAPNPLFPVLSQVVPGLPPSLLQITQLAPFRLRGICP